MQIGVVAPSSKLPLVEFRLGLDKIREAGMNPIVHPQCRKSHLFFAGTDEERASAFFEYAVDPRFSVVWSARGGYGAARLLPYLERYTAERGVPDRKLLMGYSDATALLEYVRNRWGWSTLHSPMPAMRKFCVQKNDEWGSLIRFIYGGHGLTEKQIVKAPWEKKALKFITSAPSGAIEGELVGGNLAVWTSLIGTPYAPQAKGKMVFLEDVDEPLYRIDRMIHQLAQAGAFKEVKAILLGNFLNCRDTVAKVLGVPPKNAAVLQRMLNEPKPEELKPLRKKLDERRGLRQIFGELGYQLGIPVAEGMPVGHGPEIACLPLGAEYRLDRKGQLKLLHWSWMD
jgi:muramoyltetrapeptide carboxypeptidase